MRQRLCLEIHRDERQGARNGDAGRREPVLLLWMCGGMIDLEDPEGGPRVRAAVHKRVETGAQNHLLRGAAADSSGELVLRETAPNGHEGSYRAGDGAALGAGVGRQLRRGLRADDRDSQRIVEHPGRIEKLVSRAPHRDAHRRAARAGFVHRSVPTCRVTAGPVP